MNIFSANSLLGRFLNWTADIVILNFLWLICSLPIFTIGASTTALYYSLMKKQRRDEGYIHTNFFKSFKDNFKQATIIWLILLAIGGLLWVDLRIGIYFSALTGTDLVGKVMIVLSVILFIPYLFILTYIFPVQAKFENTIKNNIKNALLFSIAHLGYTFLIFVFFASFVVLTIISRAFIGVEILCGFGLYGYLTSNIFIMVFRKHLPDEIKEDEEASGMNKVY